MRKGFTRILSWLIVSSLLCIVTSAPAGAQAWFFGKNKVQYKDFDWNILTTPHFDIHFSEGYRDLAARTAIVLEYGYDKLSRDFSHNIAWRIPVILYGSHSDFQQTNVTWSLIPEGVQAFAEPLRKRMVLHFGGSNVDFAHTTIHELVHIFTFDIVYGSLMRSVFSRNLLFQIPLWFAEGLAEYYSVGYDDEGEMFMRDATVFDYLPDLNYAYGYMTYKSGQAAIYYINETYGADKVMEIMDHLHHQRSMELALRSTLGLSTQELSRDWKKYMRRKYWPLYTDKKEPEYYGRRLTDHVEDHHYMNNKPVLSPDGEYIVYFSDRKGLDAIYLMNVVTGKVEKRLLTGSMSTRFESIRSMKSNLSYSPDGSKITFVAKSDGRDKLFVMKVPSGKITEEIDLPLDFFYSPSWSPDGRSSAMVGTKHGQTDIYVYRHDTGDLERLTDDIEDEKDPVWFPDGERIAYCRYPRVAVQPVFSPDSNGIEKITGVDFRSRENVLKVDADIWTVDLDSGEKSYLIGTPGNESSPIILPAGELVFTSDESGISNLFRGSIEVGSYYRFTDVLGGIFSATYSENKDRLVFSAMSMAGYDLFIMDGFSQKSRESYSTGSPHMAGVGAKSPIPFGVVEETGETDESFPYDTLAAADFVSHDSILISPGGSETSDATDDDDEEVKVSGRMEGIRAGGLPRDPRRDGIPVYEEEKPPLVVVDEDSDEDIHPDTLEAIRDRLKTKIGTVQPYDIKFSPDYVGNGMGLFFSTGFGFGLMNQVAFSDLLGDHHLYFSFNIYRSLEDSDFMVSYYYLKKRIDYAVGLFQFKNYLSSRVSSIGETFLDYRFFTERNYGVFGLVSFPFSTFTRFDLEFQGFVSEREFFDYRTDDESGSLLNYFVPGESSSRRLFQPTISLVHDSAYFGSFGPVIGSRWMLSLSRAISFSGDDVSRTTAFFDYRKYFPLFYRNYLAFRGMGVGSTGEDPRFFFLGGPLTLRGYDYLQFSGSRAMLFNLEYRYPLVDAIIFGWPGRWGIRNIGGTFFLDTGSVWGDNVYIETMPEGIEPRTINDLKFYSDFGLGFYMRLGFLVLNFQLGWPTDFSRTGRPIFHFYLGPQF
jgi:Tol biopolymer transport system component